MNSSGNTAPLIALGIALVVAGLIGLAVSTVVLFPLVSLIAGGALIVQALVRQAK